ncbi:hypothetical protein [Streptomyces sp. NPDC057552]|uniref:hypothetical protein n=1 Tax=Streptomyces sp. NPDC057552 TaxID=3350537 RepID=UPI0036827D7C
MAVSLIKDNPLAYSGRSILEIAMESSANLNNRAFQLGRELDEARRELAAANFVAEIFNEAGRKLALDLEVADLTIELLRMSLDETRRLRDERERALLGELAHYKALADAH